MALSHEIRTQSEGIKKVMLTPISAIRKQCIECMGFNVGEVRNCTDPHCTLYPFRMGQNPSRESIGKAKNLPLGGRKSLQNQLF